MNHDHPWAREVSLSRRNSSGSFGAGISYRVAPQFLWWSEYRVWQGMQCRREAVDNGRRIMFARFAYINPPSLLTISSNLFTLLLISALTGVTYYIERNIEKFYITSSSGVGSNAYWMGGGYRS
jgi:hypothetical protein